MRRMTDEEIYVWDRRKSAVHEAGHFVIAEWWSGEGPCPFLSASIWPIEDRGPDTRMWGAVAAMLDIPDTENDPYTVTDSLLCSELDGMSPTDWQTADADPAAMDWPTEQRLKRAVRAVAVLLAGRLRPRLLQVAEHLELEGWADADHPSHATGRAMRRSA